MISNQTLPMLVACRNPADSPVCAACAAATCTAGTAGPRASTWARGRRSLRSQITLCGGIHPTLAPGHTKHRTAPERALTAPRPSTQRAQRYWEEWERHPRLHALLRKNLGGELGDPPPQPWAHPPGAPPPPDKGGYLAQKQFWPLPNCRLLSSRNEIACCRGAPAQTIPLVPYVSVQKQSLNPVHQPP
jgi:hypothetical protein